MPNRYKGQTIASGIGGLISGFFKGRDQRQEMLDKIAEQELAKRKLDIEEKKAVSEKENKGRLDKFNATKDLFQLGQGRDYLDPMTGKVSSHVAGASPQQLSFMASQFPEPLDVSGFGVVPPKSSGFAPTPPTPRADPALETAQREIDRVSSLDPKDISDADVASYKAAAALLGLKPTVTPEKHNWFSRNILGNTNKNMVGIGGKAELGPDMSSPAAPASPGIPQHVQDMARQLQEKYKTPDDVAKDFHAGKLSRETATKILESVFGMK